MQNENIKVIDCTVRDGGIMNNWAFSTETVRKIYEANKLAGVDIMEMGYRVSPKVFNRDDHGVWRFCDEQHVRSAAGTNAGSMKIAVMGDIGRVHKEDFIPRDESVIDIFRLACYVDQIDEAIGFSDHLNGLGYETFFNIMAVSTQPPDIVEECLRKVNRTGATGVYLADTFGSLYPAEVSERLMLYRELCPDLAIGFHGHNNIQLALANSMTALEFGIEYIDASYYGMGRGAGNTPLELLLSVIPGREFELSPIMKVIQTEIEPMMEKYKWGYRIPYAISGMLNEHPRKALSIVQEDKGSCWGKFYDESREDRNKKLSGVPV